VMQPIHVETRAPSALNTRSIVAVIATFVVGTVALVAVVHGGSSSSGSSGHFSSSSDGTTQMPVAQCANLPAGAQQILAYQQSAAPYLNDGSTTQSQVDALQNTLYVQQAPESLGSAYTAYGTDITKDLAGEALAAVGVADPLVGIATGFLGLLLGQATDDYDPAAAQAAAASETAQIKALATGVADAEIENSNMNQAMDNLDAYMCSVFHYNTPNYLLMSDATRAAQLITQLSSNMAPIRSQFQDSSQFPAAAVFALPRVIFANIVGYMAYRGAGGVLGPCSTCGEVETMMSGWDAAIATYTASYGNYINNQATIALGDISVAQTGEVAQYRPGPDEYVDTHYPTHTATASFTCNGETRTVTCRDDCDQYGTSEYVGTCPTRRSEGEGRKLLGSGPPPPPQLPTSYHGSSPSAAQSCLQSQVNAIFQADCYTPAMAQVTDLVATPWANWRSQLEAQGFQTRR